MQAVDHSNTVIVNVSDLRLGMYVSYLDRPWTDTELPFQGFAIRSEEELQQLREACEYVFVDAERGEFNQSYSGYFERRGNDKAARGGFFSAARKNVYRDAHATEKEFPAAKKAHADLWRAVIHSYETARAGNTPDLAILREALGPVVDSVERMPDGLLYMLRTQASGEYLYRHAAACAVMACAVGRHLGLARSMLERLALGGSLLDIGKTRIPVELLNRPNAMALSKAELEEMRRHVEYGVEMVEQAGGDNQLLAMLNCHHERHSGKGYPRGLAQGKISPVGQIAAVVDMFDAMVSERQYGRRATPAEAMLFIKRQRGNEFDKGLVDAFVATFGPFPTGSLVSLNTGEVGFVIQQNRAQPQLPRVYLMLDEGERRMQEFRTVDLAAPRPEGSRVLYIKGCLPSGSFGIEY